MKLSECRSFSCSCSSPCQIRIHIRSWFAFLTSWMPFKACIRVHGNLQFDVSFASIPFFRRFTNEVMIKLGTHMSTVSHDKKDQLQRGPRIHGLEKQHLSLGQLIKAGIHFLGDLLFALPWKLCSPLLLGRVPFQQFLGRLALGNFLGDLLGKLAPHSFLAHLLPSSSLRSSLQFSCTITRAWQLTSGDQFGQFAQFRCPSLSFAKSPSGFFTNYPAHLPFAKMPAQLYQDV